MPNLLSSQGSNTIEGSVFSNGTPIIGANIIIKKTTKGTSTNIDGDFSIKKIVSNKITLVISALNHQKKYVVVDFKDQNNVNLKIELKESDEVLDEVVVRNKTQIRKLKEKGFAISSIKTEAFLNAPTDVNAIIDNTPGVILRVNGGLGSSFDLTVNGLSGNYIKYFYDGVAMENWGSALSLNNFPVNLIERIDIYKGVVPVEIGADALGGAVNIVGADLDKKLLDASYTTGSFNTHIVGFTGQTHSKKNLFLKVSSYFNYSDNNYWVNNVNEVDEFGNILGTMRVRRFHDDYKSMMISSKFGFINKKFADELTLNFTYANNRNNIQHPEISINEVYGGLHSKNESFLGYLKYQKKFKKLDVKWHTLYGKIRETYVDTLARNYDWLGNYTDRSEFSGEFYNLKSIFNLTDEISSSSLNIGYTFNKNNITKLNFSTNNLTRQGDDEINPNNNAFTNPNKVAKHIIGLSHETRSITENLRLIGFAKYYGFKAKINNEVFADDEFILSQQDLVSKLNTIGYGITSSYSFSNKLLGKLSYERAYRLPEANEILGNGFLTRSNQDLKEEQSDNINLEFLFDNGNTTTNFSYETNLFYRNAKDFIRVISSGVVSQFINEQDVRIFGIENSATLKLNKKYDIDINVTYQNLTSRTEFDEGLPNINYNSRIPNVPYFFGNLRAGVNFFDQKDDQDLNLWVTSRYTNEFFLNWESLGNLSAKNKIPTQFTNDVEVSYSYKEKYNISATARNVFDADSFDNFNIQKPGRAFYVKLRYFLK